MRLAVESSLMPRSPCWTSLLSVFSSGSTSFAHLANIALATGMRIEWDAENEVITNNHAANDLLHYEYRSPWTLT